MPSRAGRAGFFTTTNLAKPGSTKSQSGRRVHIKPLRRRPRVPPSPSSSSEGATTRYSHADAGATADATLDGCGRGAGGRGRERGCTSGGAAGARGRAIASRAQTSCAASKWCLREAHPPCEEPPHGGDFLDPDPRCRGDLPCAGEPRARDHDFVDDDPWNDDLGVKGPQKLEVSRTTQVDERAGVGNDDHYEPARASSSCRSATG
jgi:hypothetical protein